MRKLILGALALVLPIGTAVTLSAAPATAGANVVTGKGTYSCSKLLGTITFTPPIKNSAQTVKTSVISTASTCKGTDKPVITSAKSTSVSSKVGATCAGLTQQAATKFHTTYLPAGIAPSVLTGTTSSGGTSPVSFNVAGKVTGSYPSATAKAHAVIKETISQILAACGGTGLKTLHIISGSVTNN